MSNLLNVIDELDQLLFNGRQKNERRVAVDLHNILFSFGLSVGGNYVTERLPHVIRNMKVGLKDEHTRKVFPMFIGQEWTELDILFINAPSFLGHRARLNYYIEIEMQQRDTVAFQRLLDFSTFCKNKGIDLFPILVTNMRESGYVQDICIINVHDLRKSGAFYERYMNDVKQIPGLAYDDAASCLHILDVTSNAGERAVKEQLLVELRNRYILKRKAFDFRKFVTETVSLGDCLDSETSANFNRRMVEYVRQLKEKDLLIDTADGRAHQLTPLSGKLILKWRSVA